jgi:Uma2 family endonuclease
MSSGQVPTPSALERLIAPSAEQWRAMSPDQRQRFLIEVNAALQEEHERVMMTEGRPHRRAKNRTLDRLGQYVRRSGRKIYLADDMAVHYPGEVPFEPDVLAVLEVEDTGDEDERLAWVVVDEGKGPDWILEVHYLGERAKDFVRNVERYARVGVQEYFIYDRRRQSLTAFALPHPGARVYQAIKPRFGRFPSAVLGLDIAVAGDRLRFFSGDAELPGSDDLVDELGRLVDEVQERRERAEALAEQERARAEEERTRAVAALQQATLSILTARGLPVSEIVRNAIACCTDRDRLTALTVRAATVTRDLDLVDDSPTR